MKSPKLANKKVTASTQHHLDIAEIKEDCVLLKDGTLRAVLLVSSINFSLKSEDEQNAIIAAYIGFLNFLEFPLQIVIQSRRLDIDGYLERLKKIEKEQTNELLRMQTTEYRQYVSELVEIGDIMTKRFYVIVPYDPLSDRQKSWWKRLFGLFAAAKDVKLSQQDFIKRRHALFQRVEHIVSGLASMSLKSVLLDTQSLIELYYNTYNPDIYNKEKLVEIDKLRVEE
ncbi:MAG: hypothetical protein A2729_03385 [Candidatus Buchananbacteria bacterium RIFCSPHIGHO2_01_FULL_39_14]|uniref:TraC-like domain-containing protein n=2 Tax=Candidatus Buchananiibacteriota TaxID=1817903 RepID=A0A1G1YW02_9BACT|nr:MAG: hypothetical protein A2729_03385 [Candidatus Buchananbacteria bacterium RIFCSPHIGHO2_01_FULL_39_14]OGY48351.1 MAG: hypothetical protein A3D39_02345 [Candidatus Buchananbacteria bacterium RIFCSPHIGHO2_02_FULL_39_17]OGY55946.1 MAG: hypothetical protein A2912_03095 [Candidatus Buchananbacteria bacterium RIFCSPLOWO2_01_FULL_40_23b]